MSTITSPACGMRLLEGCVRLSKMPPSVIDGGYRVPNCDSPIPIIAAFAVDDVLLAKLVAFQTLLIPGATILVTEMNSSCLKAERFEGVYAPHIEGLPFLRNFFYQIAQSDRVVLVPEGFGLEVLAHKLSHDFYFNALSPLQRIDFTERTDTCLFFFAAMKRNTLEKELMVMHLILEKILELLSKRLLPDNFTASYMQQISQLANAMRPLVSAGNFDGLSSLIRDDKTSLQDGRLQLDFEKRRFAAEVFAYLASVASGHVPEKLNSSLSTSKSRVPFLLENFFRQYHFYDNPEPMMF